MTTAQTARMLDHSVAAIHGGMWSPSLAKLIANAAEADETVRAIYADPNSHESAIGLAEDASWTAMQALRRWFAEAGVGPELQRKLGGLL